MRLVPGAAFAAGLLVIGPVADPALRAQAPGFTARVDTVRVDVSVRRDRQPVQGLSASDFEVLDDGVRQEVTLVASDEAPLQVVLALDVSGSVQGRTLNQLRDAGLRLTDALRDGDQAALLTFTGVVSIRSPLTSELAVVRRALDLEPAAGNTSLVDAAHAAMVMAEGGAGRPLVIVFSDGADTASFLPSEAALETARRTGAVVYAVTTPATGKDGFLDDLVGTTGGARVEIDDPGRFSEAVARVLEEFRHRYLLSYSPRGVASTGWHELEVRVRNRRVDVRARPGYWAD